MAIIVRDDGSLSLVLVRLWSTCSNSENSRGVFRITVSLMNRANPVSVPGFPTTPYIENIGVRPDIVQDYMTSANLLGVGAPYVSGLYGGDRESRRACSVGTR